MQKMKYLFVSVLVFWFMATVCCTSALASSGMESLPDVNLNEGISQSIPVEGDFQLIIKFRAKSATDKNNPPHEAKLELLLGEERLVIGFGGLKSVGAYGGSFKYYGADGEEKSVDETWNYTGVNKDLPGKTVRVDLCRTGDTVTLKVKKSRLIGSKLIMDITIPLEGAAQNGQVYLSGYNLILSDIQWNMKSTTADGVSATDTGSEKSFAVELMEFIAILAISTAVFWLVRRKITVRLRRAVDFDFSLSAAVISVLFLSFGGLMIFSWINYPGANALLEIVNRIFSPLESSLSIPLEGSLFSGKIFVFAVIAVGIIILILQAVMGDSVAVIPAMLVAGALGMISLYSWAIMFFVFISKLVSELFAAILVVVLIGGATAAVSSTNESEYQPEPDPVTEHKESKVTDVWREDGYFNEHLKVSRDGERYYDPDDGEWHRIKK